MHEGDVVDQIELFQQHPAGQAVEVAARHQSKLHGLFTIRWRYRRRTVYTGIDNTALAGQSLVVSQGAQRAAGPCARGPTFTESADGVRTARSAPLRTLRARRNLMR